MFCKKCGNMLNDNDVFCGKCGTKIYAQKVEVIDKPSTLLNLVGFFAPLVGLILYLILKDEEPIRARAIGKWSIIGVVSEMVLTILVVVLWFVGIFSIMAMAHI